MSNLLIVTYAFIVLSWSLSTEVHKYMYNLACGTDMDNLEKAREGMSHQAQNLISTVPVSIPEF